MRGETLQLIPVARPWMGEAEADAARRAILSGWVTQGPEVAAFEREFAAAIEATHACAVSSCTAALHLALLAVGVAPGDEVVTVSHSFIATANAIRYCGATPVFVDVQSDTFNMDPGLVEGAITARTKALLVVHQLGMPADVRRLLEVARRRRLPVVEDAACAIGSEIRLGASWERIGRPHGDVACFSFHPRKLLSTGDGGMVTTADPAIDEKVRLLRQQGMDVTDSVRHASPQVVFERYPVVGFNYRMTDIQAAVGREQLKRLSAIVARRRELGHRYGERLKAVPGVIVPAEPEWAKTNWQSYTIRLDAPLDQRVVMQRLLDEGVATRRGAMNAHREAAFAPGSFRVAGSLDRSEQAQNTTVVLPMYHDLSQPDQDRVVEALSRAVRA